MKDEMIARLNDNIQNFSNKLDALSHPAVKED